MTIPIPHRNASTGGSEATVPHAPFGPGGPAGHCTKPVDAEPAAPKGMDPETWRKVLNAPVAFNKDDETPGAPSLFDVQPQDHKKPKAITPIHRFTLTWRNGAYYVSAPGLPSPLEVVDSASYDALTHRDASSDSRPDGVPCSRELSILSVLMRYLQSKSPAFVAWEIERTLKAEEDTHRDADVGREAMKSNATDLQNLCNRLAAVESNGDYNARNFVDVPTHILKRMLQDLMFLNDGKANA